MQGNDGGQGEDGRESEAEHHNSVEHLYPIRAIKSRCSETNITPELLSDLWPPFFWRIYLLWYCASPKLAEIQSIYLLVRDFNSLRIEQRLRWME